jgi:hypothetical protein
MHPAVERRLGGVAGGLLRRKCAAQPEGTHQVRPENFHKLQLAGAAIGVVAMIGDGQSREAPRTAVDDYAGRVVTEPARPHILIVVFCFLQLFVGDEHLGPRRLAHRKLVHAREIGTGLGVVVDIGLQIIGIVVLRHPQR